MTGAESLSPGFNPSQQTRPTSCSLTAPAALPTAIMAAEAAPRQGWKPVRVKTRQSRGFSEADSPIPKGETPTRRTVFIHRLDSNNDANSEIETAFSHARQT